MRNWNSKRNRGKGSEESELATFTRSRVAIFAINQSGFLSSFLSYSLRSTPFICPSISLFTMRRCSVVPLVQIFRKLCFVKMYFAIICFELCVCVCRMHATGSMAVYTMCGCVRWRFFNSNNFRNSNFDVPFLITRMPNNT